MTFRSKQTSGFTLVELMVSMAIGSMILLTAAALLGGSTEGYKRVGGSVAAESEARALITRLGADLATGRFHKDAAVAISLGTWPCDHVGFLSLQPAQAQSDAGRIGDLCAVNYYLKDLNIGGRTVRCLMRGFRESRETFAALGNDNIERLFAPQNGIDEPVAFGVVSFQARPMIRAAGGAWTYWTPGGNVAPGAFDVRLVIARRELARRLRTSADWNEQRRAGRRLESSNGVGGNPDLEVYEAMLRFGLHEIF